MQATFRHVRKGPRKIRRVVDLIRGKLVSDALDLLKFSKIVSAKDVSKLIRSAVANASQKPGVNLNRLYVRTIFVNEGPTLKRIITRARGSADRMEKKMSHIHVTLGEKI